MKLSKGIASFWAVLRLAPMMEILKHLKFLNKDYREFVKIVTIRVNEWIDSDPSKLLEWIFVVTFPLTYKSAMRGMEWIEILADNIKRDRRGLLTC